MGYVVEAVTCETNGGLDLPARFAEDGASSVIIDQKIYSPPKSPYFTFQGHQLLCSTFTYSFDESFAYTSMNRTAHKVTPKPTPEPEVEVYCSDMVDIILVIDGSGSLKLEGFQKAQSFAEQMVLHSEIAADKVQIGIVQYSGPGHYDDPTVGAIEVSPISADRPSLTGAVLGMQFTGGSTHTGEAMELALKLLEGGRANAHKAVLVVTDGDATDWGKLEAAAEKVRKEAALMFAVVTEPGGSVWETQAVAYAFSTIVTPPSDDNLHVEESYAALVTKVSDYAKRLCEEQEFSVWAGESDDDDGWDW
jgi:uncharacterized protein YegL